MKEQVGIQELCRRSCQPGWHGRSTLFTASVLVHEYSLAIRTSTKRKPTHTHTLNTSSRNGDVERLKCGVDVVPFETHPDGHRSKRRKARITTRRSCMWFIKIHEGTAEEIDLTGIVDDFVEPAHSNVDAIRGTEPWL